MTFRLYTDKTSLRKKNSRYLQGGTSEAIGDRVRWWEKRKLPEADISDIVYVVNNTYAGKPDLIAFDMYKRNDLAWIVLQYNNIVDVNTELAEGSVIRLPSQRRLSYQILNKATPAKRLRS